MKEISVHGKKAFIDRIQQEAFMEGYQYAIKVLNECMVKKKEN